MSQSISRVSLPAVAGILVCGATIVALAGCHHRSAAPQEFSAAERPTMADREQSSDGRLLRRFPGVNVIATRSGGFLIRILSGMVGEGEPLYVIDGAPIVVERSRGIDWFKPEDVVRISVLKFPAETAVYGPRGVSGVILITTKQGATQRKRGR